MSHRARWLVILTVFVALDIAGHMGLRSGLGLNSDVSIALAGLLTWSATTIIIAERIGRDHLTLWDYRCVSLCGFGVLNLAAMRTGFALSPQPSDPSTILALLATLPAFAIDTVTRHVVFTREERDTIRAGLNPVRDVKRHLGSRGQGSKPTRGHPS